MNPARKYEEEPGDREARIYPKRQERGRNQKRYDSQQYSSQQYDPYRSEQEAILKGSLWMVGLTLALFFIPLVNGVIGGVVGGYKVGRVRRALLAAILPAIVVAFSLWVVLGVMGLPFVGIIAGVAVGGWVFLASLGIFLGAAVGGAFGDMRRGSL
jgi:hypothetical protein